MNTKQKGDLAVAQCISQISLMGHEVLLPLGDRKPYDLVVDIRGQLNKVQVKYAGIGYKNKCVVQLLRKSTKMETLISFLFTRKEVINTLSHGKN